MERMIRVLLAGIVAAALVVSSGLTATGAYFADQESSVDNILRAWVSNLWVQTTQEDFEAGVPTDVDTSSSPGDVKLATTSNWYDTNWLYRREITINHILVSDVDSPSVTYTDFPVLVCVTGLSTDHMEPNGAAIRFTSSDGTTEIPREIESCSGGTLWAWVKTTLTQDYSDSTDDVIYMYYGYPEASEPPEGSTYGAQNVWASNYVMVQHMQGASQTALDDSTNSNNDVTTEGGDPTYQQSGQIDYAVDFDGSADYVAVDDDTSLDLVNALTISGWFYFDTDIGSIRLVSKEKPGSWSYRLLTLDNGVFGFNDGLLMQLSSNGSSNTLAVQINNALTSFKDEWVFFATTYNGSTLRLYVNAMDIGSNNGSISIYNSDTRLGIGASGEGGWPLNGLIDEVRVSDTARSAEWIQTCYNNQNEPSSFNSVGSEEGQYVSSGTIASQVLDTGSAGTTWSELSWTETLETSTDIAFKVRVSDIVFLEDDDDATLEWSSVAGPSPVTSGLPSGRYMQWQATLATSDTSITPTLHEVRISYY